MIDPIVLMGSSTPYLTISYVVILVNIITFIIFVVVVVVVLPVTVYNHFTVPFSFTFSSFFFFFLFFLFFFCLFSLFTCVLFE